MKTTLDFLEAVKTKHGFTSDYQLSKHLECTRGAISSYRTGRTHLDEEMACKIADDLGIEAGFVLSCIAAERSKSPTVKKAWEWTAQHLGGLAAVLAIVAIMPLAPSLKFDDAIGFALAGFSAPGGGQSVYYVKSHWAIIAALVTLAVLAFPYNRAPKKRRENTDKLPGNPPTQN